VRKPTPLGLNANETDQTKVSEWKRGMVFATGLQPDARRRCPAAPALTRSVTIQAEPGAGDFAPEPCAGMRVERPSETGT
jgi:hypothetical protein